MAGRTDPDELRISVVVIVASKVFREAMRPLEGGKLSLPAHL
jgi:hypothetical protein